MDVDALKVLLHMAFRQGHFLVGVSAKIEKPPLLAVAVLTSIIKGKMIIFTGSGRSGTTYYSKVFGTHHEYRCSQLIQSMQEPFTTLAWQYPHSDLVADKVLRRTLMEQHLAGVDVEAFCDSCNLYIHFLDSLYDINPAVRIVLGARDGRDFARSGIIRRYHDGSLYSGAFLTPNLDDPFYSRWRTMTPIEKMAWLWADRYKKALERLKAVPTDNWMLVRLEDLVSDPVSDNDHLKKLENFLSRKAQSKHLGIKHNANAQQTFPTKDQWTSDMNKQFFSIAGETMGILGYPTSPQHC
jgi:hypothetical protein